MDELLRYYNRELEFLRKSGAQFAEDHPKIAGRLRLGPEISEDPHVARMIEAFAYLNARTRRKIEDDFPEITEAMLGVLYPHFLAPIPSTSIVQFTLDRSQSELSAGFSIARGTSIDTELIDGAPCRFRTCYPVNLWPVDLKSATLAGQPFSAPTVSFGSKAETVLRLELECFGPESRFDALSLDRLRLYIYGKAPYTFDLYELLLNDLLGIAVTSAADERDVRFLGADSLRPVGFEPNEALVDYSARSFPGYRLLSEYFSFPEKFLFVDLMIEPGALQGAGHELRFYCYFRREASDLEQFVSVDSLRLGCSPIVNLFRQRAEPIRVTHAATEYRVVPDARRPSAHEVYSIDRVVGVDEDGQEKEYHPFYSFKHGRDPQNDRAFWHATRRAADPNHETADEGTDLYLSLVDLDFDPTVAGETMIDVETTCLNRDLPRRLPFGGDQPRMNLSGGGPFQSIRCLTPPTPTWRPELRHGTRWRLVSHLSLNHLSLVDYEEGADALREMLMLYDVKNSADNRAAIEGILSIRSDRTVARVGGPVSAGICRGIEVQLQLDEEKFSGGGLFLFASVLERFFGLYSSINSFTQTVLTTNRREGEVRRWPARSGVRPLV
jgi:type VI secretion system protein ImpG